MMKATRSQAQAIANVVAALRPEWHQAGIMTALEAVADRGSAYDLAHAALYAAADPSIQTPAVIAMGGEHWMRGKALGETTASTTGRYTRCPNDGHEHEPAHNCRMCRSEHLEAPVQAGHLVPRTPTAPTERVREIVAGAVPGLRGSRLVGSVPNGVGVNGPG